MTREDTKHLFASQQLIPHRAARLTICIPTYNRAAFIDETLASIFSQCDDQVEVVIVDGASSDNTAEIVVDWQNRYPNLFYQRNDTNYGVDKDMATAVELAHGEYCWLMSSDDLFRPGAIARILEELNSNDDIYLCNVTLCDVYMAPLRDTRFLLPRRSTDRFDLSHRHEFLSYLNLATSNNALFCYMSCVAFRRSRWMKIEYSESFNESGYAHAFTLLSIIKEGARLKYISTPLVLNRSDNDSFSSMGLERRYLMDFNGYEKLADELFFDDLELQRSFLRVTTKEHPWYRLVKLRSSISSEKRWSEICIQLKKFGYARTTLAMCGILGRNLLLVRLALKLNRRFARSTLLKWIR